MPSSIPCFETTRLILRAYTMEDVDAAHQELDSHPAVWQFDPGRPLTRKERRQAVEDRIRSYGQPVFGALAVTLKENGCYIGYCGLQLYLCDRIPWRTPEVELFYKLGYNYWGHGYATEASRELIRYAFTELRLIRIVTCTHRENAHSLALLRRLGMRIEPDATDAEGILAILENDGTLNTSTP
ncbi:MAG: GNAT family N-acetyltransferase [Abitibacteriaceae bacterium]|nr:GNAT family N-acetyltransferase [Abditibacteriaceae bacterium]